MFRSTSKLAGPALVALGLAAVTAPSALAAQMPDGGGVANATRSLAVVVNPGKDPELVRIANTKAGRTLSTSNGSLSDACLQRGTP